jgi:hypothetical protein
MKLFSWRALEQLLFRKLPAPKHKKKKAPSLVTQGKLYDLKEIYTSLNNTYFNNTLDLKITWFGNANRSARRHRRLGVYCFEEKLIKIHRLLDSPDFPAYFIAWVVYHEMLHYVYPPLKAKRGRYSIHHCEFRKKEREFADYAVAKRWEKENRRLFFTLSF